MKLLSVAIPCYNSADYMEKCIHSILRGGEDVEIIIVDDGSTKDRTPEIADAYAAQYPTVIKAVHQENGGHGQAVNTGLANATGIYFKVVDSDDWLDEEAFPKVMDQLRKFREPGQQIDMMLANYIYDKEGAKHKKVMRQTGFPKNCVFGWGDIGHIFKGHYILMHSVIYRTEMLRACHLQLPQHTFYVDNIYVYKPMPYVKKMYYMDVDLYHYYIGREGQSVQEEVMIRRIDQQIRVNKIMADEVDLWKVPHHNCRKYMFNYLEIITTISTVLLLKSGTPENLAKKEELWNYIKDRDPRLYRHLRKGVFGRAAHIPGKFGRKVCVWGYSVAQKFVGFN